MCEALLDRDVAMAQVKAHVCALLWMCLWGLFVCYSV